MASSHSIYTTISNQIHPPITKEKNIHKYILLYNIHSPISKIWPRQDQRVSYAYTQLLSLFKERIYYLYNVIRTTKNLAPHKIIMLLIPVIIYKKNSVNCDSVNASFLFSIIITGKQIQLIARSAVWTFQYKLNNNNQIYLIIFLVKHRIIRTVSLKHS